jgi:glyoxylase-like metal-dependent hydrolase (beta-lactamase superfamily II)
MRTILTALATALVVSGPALAQAPDFSKVEIVAQDLGNKTYMLTGQGGNITVAVGDDAVLMVDTQFAPLHDKIKAAVAKLSPHPIKQIVVTHHHGDHTGGIGPFVKDGAVVTSHPNLKRRMAEGTTNALTGAKSAPVPAEGLPTQTYTGDKTTISVKGRTAQVTHLPRAHTDGDSAIYLADANVLATGDIVSIGNRYPNIDVGVGAGIKGMVAAVDTFIKMSNDQTKVVPGHGTLMTRADLVTYRALLQTAQDRVAKLIAEGKSEDEVVAAKPIQDLEKQAGANEMATTNFLKLIYRSLKV